MPPFRVTVNCTDCRFKRSGYAQSTMAKGDKHAIEKGHHLEVWRLTPSVNFYARITPQSTSDSW